jgi:hypothetical protein
MTKISLNDFKPDLVSNSVLEKAAAYIENEAGKPAIRATVADGVAAAGKCTRPRLRKLWLDLWQRIFVD